MSQNVFYPNFLLRMAQTIFGFTSNLGAVDVKVVPVSAAYIFDASHTDVTDLSGTLAPAVTLADATLDGLTLRAGNLVDVWEGITNPIVALVLYIEGTTETLLVAYLGNPSNQSFPLSTGGQLVDITWAGDGIVRV